MDDIVTADSIIEGYRHGKGPESCHACKGELYGFSSCGCNWRLRFGDLALSSPIPDRNPLVSDNAVSVMVHPRTLRPSGPRRSPMAVAGKWLVIGLLSLTIFGLGFVGGVWQMDHERRPIEARYRADIATLKQEFGQHELAMRMGAIGEIMQREELLGQAIQEIARLNSVNKWLQGKFQTSL